MWLAQCLKSLCVNCWPVLAMLYWLWSQTQANLPCNTSYYTCKVFYGIAPWIYWANSKADNLLWSLNVVAPFCENNSIFASHVKESSFEGCLKSAWTFELSSIEKVTFLSNNSNHCNTVTSTDVAKMSDVCNPHHCLLSYELESNTS
jgi:hypothetical protein